MWHNSIINTPVRRQNYNMIRAICIYYNNENVELARQIGEFFRLAGVCITEHIYNVHDKLREKIDAISREEYGKDISIAEYNYQYKIYIVSNQQDDMYAFLDGFENKYIRINTNNFLDDYSLSYDTIRYDGSVYETIESILDDIWRNKLITEYEKKDLSVLLSVYDTSGVYELIKQTKYFYPLVCESISSQLIKQFESVIFEISGKFKETWGGMGQAIIQYAILRLAMEANIYSEKAKVFYLYDSKDLYKKCELLIENNVYENSFKLLAGEICNYLLHDENIAYDYYMDVCKSEEVYNAYAFYLKGEYWACFGQDEIAARRYFIKSIRINPEYYVAWYMLAKNLEKINNMKNATVAYTVVRNIIYPRLRYGELAAQEYYYLVNACIRLGIIYDTPGTEDVSIKNYLMVEKVWNNIGKQKLNMLPNVNINELINTIKSSVDIKSVYKSIAQLYYGAGITDLGDDYMQKA